MRPSLDEYFLRIAEVVATRATCARRQVGCVLVDQRNQILSTGYNGPPRGWPHCSENPCPGAHADRGTLLDVCEAVHAEANALIQCPDPNSIAVIYCTTEPCVSCVKLFLNTPARRVVFRDWYVGAGSQSERLWTVSQDAGTGRKWLRLPRYPA